MQEIFSQNTQTPIPSALPALLLKWYDQTRRILPWRENPLPYWVWLSEIMLQQTRVETVKPYFARFLETLPTIHDLAQAPEETLLKLWEGLGYYSRVRNLQKAAKAVVEQYGGELPSDPALLEKLPGIGSYTAGAIASIAFGVPAPAVDGNVLRVISRITASREDIASPACKKRMEVAIREIIPHDRAGDFNQSLMELGAMVCLGNGEPKCLCCPLQSICEGFQQGIAAELPVKAPKKARKIEEKTILLLRCGDSFALRQRPKKGLLAGMWELPSLDGKKGREEVEKWLTEQGAQVLSLREAPNATHIFTHVEWHMTGFFAELSQPLPEFFWADSPALEQQYALPSAFKAYFPELGLKKGKAALR